MNPKLLVEMADDMRHALGLNYKSKPYRNYFVGQSDALDMATELGFCSRLENHMYGFIYSVTKEGHKFLGIEVKK